MCYFVVVSIFVHVSQSEEREEEESDLSNKKVLQWKSLTVLKNNTQRYLTTRLFALGDMYPENTLYSPKAF